MRNIRHVNWNEWRLAGFLGLFALLLIFILAVLLILPIIGLKLWLDGRITTKPLLGFSIIILFSGILTRSALKAHVAKQPLRERKSVEPVPVPRDAMLKMIEEHATFAPTLPMVLDGYDDVDVLRARSVDKATMQDFATLIEIIENPPTYLEIGSEYALQWYYEVGALLGEWLKRDADMVVARLGPLLERPDSRAVTLDAFCYSNSESRIAWLKPLVTQISELTEVEQTNLINALGQSLTPESVMLLRQLKTSLPEAMQSETDFFLQRVS